MEYEESLEIFSHYNNWIEGAVKVKLFETTIVSKANTNSPINPEYPCYIRISDYSKNQEILSYINERMENQFILNKYGDIVLKDIDITTELYD